jgi:hypothetical protein
LVVVVVVVLVLAFGVLAFVVVLVGTVLVVVVLTVVVLLVDVLTVAVFAGLALALFVAASPQAIPRALNVKSVESAINFFISILVLLSFLKE